MFLPFRALTQVIYPRPYYNAQSRRFRERALDGQEARCFHYQEQSELPKQQLNYVSIDGLTRQLDTKIHELFAEYEMNYKPAKISDADFAKRNIESDCKNVITFARELQKCVMLACYCNQPALISDWSTLKITSAAVNRLDPNLNWIQILRGGRIRLHLNDFKNRKTFGKHISLRSRTLSQQMVLILRLI
jgi:hypothetical protein